MTRFASKKDLVIACLRGYQGRPRIYKEEAREILKKVTGQDFGYDVGAWHRWLDQHEYNKSIWREAIDDVLRGPRKPVLGYFQKGHTVETFDPTSQQVKECVEGLNTDDSPRMYLRTSMGMLLLWGVRDERIVVFFSTRNKKRWRFWERPVFLSRLLDPEVTNPDDEILLATGDKVASMRRSETVSKTTAVEVTIHFLQHNTLPKGFHWAKDVEPYT